MKMMKVIRLRCRPKHRYDMLPGTRTCCKTHLQQKSDHPDFSIYIAFYIGDGFGHLQPMNIVPPKVSTVRKCNKVMASSAWLD
jgi:hypothetical protein